MSMGAAETRDRAMSGSTQRTGVSGERGACFIEGEATSDLKGTDLVASLEIDTRPIL